MLGPGADKSAREQFKCYFSIHCSPAGLVGMSPVALQSQMFWRLISQVSVLKVAVFNVKYNPFTSQIEVPGFEFTPDCGCLTRGGVYDEIISKPFLHNLIWFLSHFLM